jgi:galactokinase
MFDQELRVSAPGRICLFGEHQDYFGLSVIAAAINLRIFIAGTPNSKKTFQISMPDIQEEEEFALAKTIPYKKERDYLRSAVNVLQRKGIHFDNGWNCLLKGTIPINSGTASSSALVVAWVKFLLEACRNEKAKLSDMIAEWSFETEVTEFKEPGGKMDHYASALGGILSLNFGEKLRMKILQNPLNEFVLADSMIRKDTKGTLGFIKSHVFQGISEVQKKIPDFSLHSSLGEREQTEIDKLEPTVRRLLKGTVMTRDLTSRGKKLFEAEDFNHIDFGDLLSRQQDVLRDYLQISIPEIDKMIEASMKAGALGAKINGSGQGGCVFAYTPGKSEPVAEALRKLGAEPHIVKIDEGVKVDR